MALFKVSPFNMFAIGFSKETLQLLDEKVSDHFTLSLVIIKKKSKSLIVTD